MTLPSLGESQTLDEKNVARYCRKRAVAGGAQVRSQGWDKETGPIVVHRQHPPSIWHNFCSVRIVRQRPSAPSGFVDTIPFPTSGLWTK